MGANLGFASAVAEFGMLLRGSKLAGNATYESVVSRARTFRASDPDGYRSEFVKLVDLAGGLQRMSSSERR
jgi:Ca-activated chloride channel family protein